MSKRFSFRFTRKFIACLAVLLVVLQGPLSSLTRSHAQDRGATAAATADPLGGYTVNVQDTDAVNGFLAGSTAGNLFLNGLYSRGIDSSKVNYISLSGDPADSSNDLTLLANKINSGGGAKVASVDMLIGAYQGADGKLDGEVLLVANLAAGGKSLLAGFQANDDALNGTSDPVAYGGDYFASAVTAQSQAVVAVLICWIRCYVIQQIIIKLRCVIITIIECFRVGPIIICIRTRIILCQLIIIVRTIIVCYINCVLIVVITPTPIGVQPADKINGALNRMPGEDPARRRSPITRPIVPRAVPAHAAGR